MKYKDPKPTTPLTDEDTDMLEECESQSEKLSDWESRYIDSMSRKDEWTEDQRKKVKEIYTKVTRE